MHFIEGGIGDAGNALFVMGGQGGQYQFMLVEALCSLYAVPKENVLFPRSRVILEIGNDLTYFSDQKDLSLHPAQMAAPSSMRMLRTLCNAIPIETARLERIYISRRDAALRRVANEDELMNIARANGFSIVQMSEYSVKVQIGLVAGAKFIIGPHGMGLSHILFHKGPLSILELFHPTLGTEAYAVVARALGFRYEFLIGESIEDGKGSYAVDVEKFTRGLESLLSL